MRSRDMSGFDMYALTDIGTMREQNEDCVSIAPEHGIAVLADGMGGHRAGEVASRMAVDAISGYLQTHLRQTPDAKASLCIRAAISEGNKIVYAASQQRPEFRGMGTTVVAAVFCANHLTLAHVGDSRMYRLRNKVLQRVTEDHSLVQEQIRRGLLTAADARHSTSKNVVTRALGVTADVEPDIVDETTCSGDVYMMCSDGLTDVVPEDAIRLTLIRYSGNLCKPATQLVHLANNAGGTDNVSVILIRMQ